LRNVLTNIISAFEEWLQEENILFLITQEWGGVIPKQGGNIIKVSTV